MTRLEYSVPKAVSCEMTVTSIRYHMNRIMRCTTRNGQMLLWRLVIRVAQTEHDRLLAELDALNSLKADPATEVPVA